MTQCRILARQIKDRNPAGPPSSMLSYKERIGSYDMRSHSEFLHAIKAVPWVCAARVGLWTVPFRRLQGTVNRFARAARPRRSKPSVKQLSWSVSAASRFVPRATCLTQAVALHILLKRAGYQSRLRIGVSSKSGEFESHAWVENHDHVVIGNAESQRFTPMLVWD
jgi:Transglutaminase-like superfamily